MCTPLPFVPFVHWETHHDLNWSFDAICTLKVYLLYFRGKQYCWHTLLCQYLETGISANSYTSVDCYVDNFAWRYSVFQTSCTAHNFCMYISPVDGVWVIVMKVCRHSGIGMYYAWSFGRLPPCKLESQIVVKQQWSLS